MSTWQAFLSHWCEQEHSSLSWLWALLPLLLAAALTIPLLNDSAYIGDEPASLIAAGILSSGPHSFADVCNYIVYTDPDQALGWPLLLSVWGQVVGWSEVAVRAFPSSPAVWLSPGSTALVAISSRPMQVSLLRCCSVPPVLSRLHDPRALIYTGFPLYHALHLELLAHRPAPAATRKGRAGGSAAGQHWPALVALLLRLVSARPRPVSPALCPQEPPLVATRPPARPRCPAGHTAAARFSARTGQDSSQQRSAHASHYCPGVTCSTPPSFDKQPVPS